MKRVAREELVDHVTYAEMRESFRSEVLAHKQHRRVTLDGCFTFLFETPLTVRYQVQEMMRAEQIVREKDIAHELATYNELLGGDGELGVTLLIELDDEAVRAEKLTAWVHLMEHVYVVGPDGKKVYAKVDKRQVGDDRLSSVQYIKFDVKGHTPIAIGVDHKAVTVEMPLSPETKAALTQDLTA